MRQQNPTHDVAVVGGGLGAVAAALTVTDLGYRCILLAHDSWLGGQISSQAVPPDEHPWIESLGATRRYAELRFRVRDHYRRTQPLNEAARLNALLNPGNARVSRLSAEPAIWERCIEDMLAPAQAAGLLSIRRGVRPMSADVEGDRVRAVTVRYLHDERGDELIEARWFIDATELGDLIELVGAESVIGAESRSQTGEIHAIDTSDPTDQQAASWCCALEWSDRNDDLVQRPSDYERWTSHTIPGWPGPLFSWNDVAPDTLTPRVKSLLEFERNPQGRDEFSLWVYRRMRAASVYDHRESVHEATLVNWVQIDYTGAPLVGVGDKERQAGLDEARRQTTAFVYWLQHDAPRHDGGIGYPELRLIGDPLGSTDGLAREIYVREARRVQALVTVSEADVGVEMRSDMPPGATQFGDTVGVGSYRIDLHPSTSGRNYVDISTWPFQIPLGALVPVRVRNLIAGAKNIGTTHVTNGCYRLHPIEWNIGEAAGAAAVHCTERDRDTPIQAAAQGELLEAIQRTMVDDRGADIAWPRWARETPRLGAEMPGQRS